MGRGGGVHKDVMKLDFQNIQPSSDPHLFSPRAADLVPGKCRLRDILDDLSHDEQKQTICRQQLAAPLHLSLDSLIVSPFLPVIIREDSVRIYNCDQTPDEGRIAQRYRHRIPRQ